MRKVFTDVSFYGVSGIDDYNLAIDFFSEKICGNEKMIVPLHPQT